MKFGPRRINASVESSDAETWQDTYPVGTIFEETKVLGLEAERGIFVEIEPGLEGFVHVR
jgi:rRNA biogenesis protein RRP5